MERKRGLTFFEATLICIAAVVVINVYRVFYFEVPTQARERMSWFAASPEQEIPLAELFPWPWDRLCHTGGSGYATKDSVKKALGRPLTLSESWTWSWYGTGAEYTNNLIFLSAGGDMKIYQDYDGYRPGRESFWIGLSPLKYDEVDKRDRCSSDEPKKYCIENTKTAKLRKTNGCGWQATER